MEIWTKSGYSEAFKLFIVNEIELGRITPAEVQRKYDIHGHSTVSKWCRKYGSIKGSTKKRVPIMNDESHEIIRLQNEIKALKQELEDSRMKSVVMETFVDIAEKELGFSLRKKYGAKQSGK
jgi:transposase-like protein